MTTFKKMWWERQREKYPDKSDEEIRQIFKDFGSKSYKAGRGGFYNNPDLARKAGEKGRQARYGRKKS